MIQFRKKHLLIESDKSISLVLLLLLQVTEFPIKEKNKKITCTANIRYNIIYLSDSSSVSFNN